MMLEHYIVMLEHVQLFRDPEVSEWDQTKWPSNCTGCRGHHAIRKKSNYKISQSVVFLN